MPETWVVQQAVPDNVDLKTVANTGNVIEVRNVNIDATERVALKSTNTNTGSSSRALYSDGQVEMVAGLTGNPGITTAKIYNPSTASLARALAVTGDGGKAATISNETNDAGVLALEVNGNTTMQSLSTGNPAHVTLDVDNGSSHASARAIKAAGEVEIDAYSTGNPATIGLHVKNASTHASALALKAEGTVELDGIRFDSGYINTAAGGLNIGTNSPTAGINLGRTGENLHINSDVIRTYGELRADAGVQANANENESDLKLGTNENETFSVTIGHANVPTTVQGDLTVNGDINGVGAMDVNGDILVGAAAAAGKIDSGGSAVSPQDVKIGTQTLSADVELSRSGKLVKAVGDVRVGTTTGAGKVDAAGTPTAQALKVGSGSTTANVELGRSGQTIDMFGQERLNSNALVMNGATSHTASNSIAMIANATGHGGGPSIDFYISGVMVRYVDATGWK